MLGKVYWEGDTHLCVDVTVILEPDEDKRKYNSGAYWLYTQNVKFNVPYKSLIHKKTRCMEQMMTPYAIELYDRAYAKLYGRVLHLGLGLNYGENKIRCESMTFIEMSKDVIDNVASKYAVIHGDATDVKLLDSLGKFDTIFCDITTPHIDYTKYLNNGKIVKLI